MVALAGNPPAGVQMLAEVPRKQPFFSQGSLQVLRQFTGKRALYPKLTDESALRARTSPDFRCGVREARVSEVVLGRGEIDWERCLVISTS